MLTHELITVAALSTRQPVVETTSYDDSRSLFVRIRLRENGHPTTRTTRPLEHGVNSIISTRRLAARKSGAPKSVCPLEHGVNSIISTRRRAEKGTSHYPPTALRINKNGIIQNGKCRQRVTQLGAPLLRVCGLMSIRPAGLYHPVQPGRGCQVAGSLHPRPIFP